jgi:2-oxoisovalerate dehydrogenase E1 component
MTAAVGEQVAVVPDGDLMQALERMFVIRLLEERISTLFANGEIPGFVHTSIGQEACAVGALLHARQTDLITSTHRGHGHVIAKGLEPRRVMAELMAKESGACRGRGGSMHVAEPGLGIYGANGIVGAGLPIAVGASYAIKARGSDDVVISFFGDGAISTGAFHEAVNLAALWRLPVVFFCENNKFSEFSRMEDQHPAPISKRAVAYDIDFVQLDGNDVEAVIAGMSDVVDRVRSGDGPVLVEAVTSRGRGHYEGDQQRYRIDDDAWETVTDPISLVRARLQDRGVTAEELGALEARARETVREAEAFAREAPEPSPEALEDYIEAPRRAHRATQPTPPQAERVSFVRIIRQALHDAMVDDPSVVLAGIDVAGGNIFGVTRGLADAFPDRVLDTPISETAIMGLGVGAALSGMRPVVELMYLDFLGVCLDQLMNQAAKLRFMTGGALSVPMVVRTQFGAGRSAGSQHSQSLEALLAHLPGLTVVMPSSASDTYGLLRSAIEDDNPVVFIENRLLYDQRGDVPSADYRVPIGSAAIVRPGTDVTIVSWSRMVLESLSAAQELEAEGISAEVLDLRTISPLDRATILTSFARTNRMVIAQEAVTQFGVGAEVAAVIADAGFWSMDAPVVRLGSRFAPAPYAPSLERTWMASASDIAAAARRVVNA